MASIQVYVKTISGKNIVLDAFSTTTVGQLKDKIYSREQISPDSQKLAYIGQVLDDSSRTLQSYKIQNGATIHLVVTEAGGELMIIFVKTLTGRTVSIEIDHTSTVADAKRKIFQKEGVPIHQQQLIFSGKTLENERPLSSYNIQRDSTVHLVIKVNPEKPQARTTVQPAQKGVASGHAQNWSAEVSRKLSLTINTPTCREVKVEVNADETVLGLKQAIFAKLKVPPDHQILVCAGSHLQNQTLLSDYGITFNCTVQLSYSPSSKMNLYVKNLSGSTFILNPSVYQTIEDIKDELRNKQNLDTTHLRLIYQGKHLEESSMLYDCQLTSQCTVHIIRDTPPDRPRSPSPPPPPPPHRGYSTSHAPPPPPSSQYRFSSYSHQHQKKPDLIPILFRTIKGDIVTLMVQPHDRVVDVKRRLQEREELPRGEQISLMLGGIELKDASYLNEYKLQQDSTLLVTFKSSFPSIQLSALNISTGEIMTLDNIANSDTVQYIEERIRQGLYLSSLQQVSLVFDGILLNSVQSIGHYAIPNKSLLHVYSDGPKRCTITVSTLADVKCSCDMYTSETVSNLKTVIQNKLGIHHDEQVLVNKGQILANSSLLGDLGGEGEYTTVCLFTKVGINRTISVILPSGQSISLCMLSHQTILDLKSAVNQRCPISQLRYRGTLLEDTHCIGDYLLPDGAFLTSTNPLPSSQDQYTFCVRCSDSPVVKTIIINGQSSLRLLKILVAQEFSLSLDLLQLFFCGDLLFNEKPIDQYGFPNPCTIWAESLPPTQAPPN